MLLFETMGLVDKLNFDDGVSRFELSSPEEVHHHHHLVCQKCNQVFEVESDMLLEVERTIEEKYNFQVYDHNLTFYGHCEKCQAKI